MAVFEAQVGAYSLPAQSGARCVFTYLDKTYVVVRDGTSGLRVFKITLAGAGTSWTVAEMDTANRPTSNCKAYAACQAGTSIYIMYAVTNGANVDAFYRIFAAATDTWGSEVAIEAGLTAPTEYYCACVHDGTDPHFVWTYTASGVDWVRHRIASTSTAVGAGVRPAISNCQYGAAPTAGIVVCYWDPTATAYKSRMRQITDGFFPAAQTVEDLAAVTAPDISVAYCADNTLRACYVDASSNLKWATHGVLAGHEWAVEGTDTNGGLHPSVCPGITGAVAYTLAEDDNDDLAYYRNEAGFGAQTRKRFKIGTYSAPFTAEAMENDCFIDTVYMDSTNIMWKRLLTGLGANGYAALFAHYGAAALPLRIRWMGQGLRMWQGEPAMSRVELTNAVKVHEMNVVKDKIWCSMRNQSGTDPGAVYRITPATLTWDADDDYLEFADDTYHPKADSHTYSPYSDRVYVLFKGDNNCSIIAVIDPNAVTLSDGYLGDFNVQHNSVDVNAGTSPHILALGDALYVVTWTGGYGQYAQAYRVDIDDINEGALDIGVDAPNVETADYAQHTDVSQYHVVEYDPTSGYLLAGAQAGLPTGNARVVKINPANLSQYTVCVLDSSAPHCDDIAIYGDYAYVQQEYGSAKVHKIRISDMTLIKSWSPPKGCNDGACVFQLRTSFYVGYDGIDMMYVLDQVAMDEDDEWVPLWCAFFDAQCDDPDEMVEYGNEQFITHCEGADHTGGTFVIKVFVVPGTLPPPPSGSKLTFWVALRPVCYNGKVGAFRVYTDGENKLGTGITVMGQRATAYTQCTKSGGEPLLLNTTNYPSLAATPESIFNWTREAPLYLNGEGAGGGHADAPDVVACGEYVVIQLTIASTALASLSPGELLEFEYVGS